MFEIAELGSKVAKDVYEAAVPDLRVDLLNAQFDLREAPFSMLIVLMGDDRFGVDAVLDLLHEWMDARYIDTQVLLESEGDGERALRPIFWRFWRALPPRGRIGLYVGGWPLDVLARRLRGHSDDATFDHQLDQIEQFETSQAADGALIVKLWIHLPQKEHKKRLKKAKKNGSLQLDDVDWEVTKRHDEITRLGERLIQRTSAAYAPWTLVEGVDERHRNLLVARAVREALRARLADGTANHVGPAVATPEVPDVLGAVDLGASLDRGEYKERRDAAQARLFDLVQRARKRRVSAVLAFEGWDAAGKGGCIRRLTQPMHARDYRVVPIAAPTDEEKARPYLWRFWRQLPVPGRMILFDRSWYGRVLVERVEQFARDDEWRRAYEEINDFEQQLVEVGMPVLKFWLHLDQDEQLRRFEEREKTPYKKYKITDDDYRNRARWHDYELAVNEMVARTSTEAAPWHLVPASDKRFARVQILETVCDRLEEALS